MTGHRSLQKLSGFPVTNPNTIAVELLLRI